MTEEPHLAAIPDRLPRQRTRRAPYDPEQSKVVLRAGHLNLLAAALATDNRYIAVLNRDRADYPDMLTVNSPATGRTLTLSARRERTPRWWYCHWPDGPNLAAADGDIWTAVDAIDDYITGHQHDRTLAPLPGRTPSARHLGDERSL